jgi:serine/threonine protein kinase
MAPEQLVAAKGVPQTDPYALGITLHEMLAGKKLFTAATQYSLMTQQVKQPPTPIRELCPEVPAELERLVLDLLNKEPEDRPPSAEVVYRRLLPFVDQLGPLPGHLDPPTAASPARMYGLVLGRVFAAPAAH